MENVVVRFEHVYKEYQLGMIGGGTLRGDLQSWWARIRKKEDPNSIINSNIKQEDVGKRFLALDDIDFTVNKGDRLGIIGHNGAGKSTMLKLLSRVTAPTSGKIYVEGRIASMLEVGTGFHPELTGRENIYMNGAILGMTKAEIDKKIDDIIDFSECARFIDTPVKRYSSGMYVKLAFAVAAHLDSDILIMDEVLAVGDAKFQEKCLGKMGDVAEHEGKTVLYVSHNMNTIRKLCNKCIVLDHGKIIFAGDVEEAVAIYMDSSAVVEKSPIDLSLRKRHGASSGVLQMQCAEFLGKDNTSLNFQEQVAIKLKWWSKKEIHNLFLRMHVMRLDGTGIGVAYGEPVEAHIGENVATYHADFSELMPGKYSITLIMYERNSLGGEIRHECVEPAFSVEITANSENEMFFDWNSSWGSINFRTLMLEKDGF